MSDFEHILDPLGPNKYSFMASEKCIIFWDFSGHLEFGRKGTILVYIKNHKCYSDFRQILDLMGTKDYSSMTSEKFHIFRIQPLS